MHNGGKLKIVSLLGMMLVSTKKSRLLDTLIYT